MSGAGTVRRDKRKGETNEAWRARGGTWMYSVVVPCPSSCKGGCRGHQQLRRGFAKKEIAQGQVTKLLKEIHTGRYTGPSGDTVQECLEAWLEGLRRRADSKKDKKKRVTTLNGYRIDAERTYPYIGHIPVQDLKVKQLDAMFDELLESGNQRNGNGLAPSTVRGTYIVLGLAFDRAVLHDLVSDNVIRRSTPPTVKESKPAAREVWDLVQMEDFFQQAEDDGWAYTVHVRLVGMTGLRRSELCGLRWRQIDLDASTITVKETTVSVGGKQHEQEPKSENSNRVFLIDPDTVEMLRRHRVAQAEWRLARGLPTPDHDRVFIGPDGEGLKPDTLTQAYTRRVKRSNLPVITFHDLRHSHATIFANLTENKVEFKALSRRLGHASVAFTMERYVRVELEDQAAPLARMAAERNRVRAAAEQAALAQSSPTLINSLITRASGDS